MKASLIIPTYNRSEILCNTIELALAQNYDDYEVIVVDQTAVHPRQIQSYLDALRDRIRYHRLKEPNVSAARNLGIRMAQGQVIIFIDDDVVIDRDYVQKHVLNYSQDGIGGVMGLTLPPTEVEFGNVVADARKNFHARGVLNVGNRTEVTWTSTCNTSYLRSAVIKAGLFDEYFGSVGAWCEDADMAVRIRGLGYRLILDTDIMLVHLALASGGCENRNLRDIQLKENAHLRFYLYHILKNRKIDGTPKLVVWLSQAYRRYVLNRSALAKGWDEIARRNKTYWRLARRAFADANKHHKEIEVVAAQHAQ